MATHLSYSRLSLRNVADGFELSFRFNGARYYFQVNGEDIQDDDELLEKFVNFLQNLSDPNVKDECESWILDALREYLPTSDIGKPITIRELFTLPTSAFKMINCDGKLSIVEVKYDPAVFGDSGPRTYIVDKTSSELKSLRDKGSHGFVVRSKLPSVALIAASRVERIADETGDWEWMRNPGKVRLIDDKDSIFFFKEASKHRGHLSELRALTRIYDSGRFVSPLNTSKLLGLVTWDEDDAPHPAILGFLLEFIDGKRPTQRQSDASMEEKRKWVHQVKATVEQLHREGIIWGNVRSDNVMIDERGDAVVIGFEEAYVPAFVDHELQQMMEDEHLALRKMGGDLGLSD